MGAGDAALGQDESHEPPRDACLLLSEDRVPTDEVSSGVKVQEAETQVGDSSSTSSTSGTSGGNGSTEAAVAVAT